ncbi:MULTISPECIES: DNA topoisomerase IB [Mycolicibacterium]|uniref:DNA topoisomerase IB n=1 Tax=Mycolicibacterium TaxID=1866885 RepID=UPI0007EA758D|nr:MULTISPECIES: DNA topoisomerase IB [Mycolicibacterium]NOP95550.1 DNA topoisomerase IB [Mycolicibacterium fortuitum]OBB32142.1 DNA topoisomerase [Mycolicibacterium fortuitum]OBB52705.1 DNA topoisomerase [Mycolicibacterium fortuitum]OBB65673.1 DNA topoisomerase [Mycolicibacterium fortuitum]OBF73655.1 DNA topoisomerase [Mycolicibacterium fortuitum]
MRLRRSAVGGPGLRRVRRGRGFGYLDQEGAAVTDPATLKRIEDLVIPPAWKKVWICPHPNGHIQAVGTDVAGRRQYLYHSQWQQERGEEKFDRVLELSAGLADWRNDITGDLRRRGLTRDRVLALGLRLLDLGYFRAGGDQYAEENNSFGIATLLREHITLRPDAVEFDYPAKSGVRRTLVVEDPAVVRAVRSLQRARANGDRLLAYRNSADWTEVHAEDLNVRFKEMVGDDYTVKDLRTWHGTVLAAEAFVDADPPVNDKVIKRVESAVMREVAEALGNTPAVARSAYVDPRVVGAYRDGLTIGAAVRRASRVRNSDKRQAILDRSTARLIRKVGSQT